jgi:uncharacterized membrane protein YgcG
VTATRDRRSDPELDAELAWDERPIIGQFRGLPWWGSVLLTFGLTLIAAFVDMQRQDSLGRIYQGAFIVGCVGAVCLVRRRSLFGPMVQPPLVFAITAIGAVVFLGPASAGGGLKQLALKVALPLTSNFPTMGITTAVVVGIGVFRLWWQRDPDPEVRPNRPSKDRGPVDVDDVDDPGPGTGRGMRERPSKDRIAPAAPPPRRGREPDVDVPVEERSGRRLPSRGPRPSRDAAREPGGREAAGREPAAREPRQSRRDVAAAAREARAERPSRAEPVPDDERRGRGRSRDRAAEPPPRRRDSEGRSRGDDRAAPRREGSTRDGGRDGGGRDGGGRDSGGRDGGGQDRGGRDGGGREGRGTPPGRQPRRRPPESQR